MSVDNLLGMSIDSVIRLLVEAVLVQSPFQSECRHFEVVVYLFSQSNLFLIREFTIAIHISLLDVKLCALLTKMDLLSVSKTNKAFFPPDFHIVLSSTTRAYGHLNTYRSNKAIMKLSRL